MAEQRPVWQGQMRLSLVSFMVQIYPALNEGGTRFHQIHAPSGERIRYQKVAEGVGPVKPEDIWRGFEYEKGQFILLSDDEVEAVRLETRKTIDLVQFSKVCEIDPLYFDKSYFVVPADELAHDAFRVVRDALREKEMAGIGQLSMRGREYLVAIQASGKGMMLNTMHYEEEVRQAQEFFRQIGEATADRSLVEVAAQVIEQRTAAFDPKVYRDNYEAALRKVLDEKIKALPRKRKAKAGREERAEPAAGANVIDLMAALKDSLEVKPPAGSVRRSEGRRRKAS